jgi:hypothetical protein
MQMISSSSAVPKRLGMAALAVTCLFAAQLIGTSAATAQTRPKDGGPTAPAVTPFKSQTPQSVRDHTAKLVGRLNPAQKLRVAFGLVPRDQAGQQRLIAALQDKHSPQFHQYLTAAQWNARFAPTAASEAKVLSFAKSQGLTVTHRYPNRLLVDVEGTAAQLESAFHITLNNYSVNGKTFFSNASDPVLPDSLKSIVSSVDGLNNVDRVVSASGTTDTTTMSPYSAGPVQQLHTALHKNGSNAAYVKAMKQKAAVPTAAPGNYDPTDIYSSQAYAEDALHKQSNCCNPFHNPSNGSPAQSSIAIATAGSHFLSTDMAGWNAAFPYIAYNINEYYIDGTPSSADYEGTMDTEWATSLANSFGCYCDTAHIYLYSGVNAQFSTFDDIYNSILTNNTAKVVSSSWGCAEFYCTPDGTMNTDHNIFVAMTAQGFTMVNSSGDRGGYADCNSAHKSVSFPASDPQWLAIGATNLELAAGPVYQSQTAWGDVGNCAGNGGGTGGGCSAKYAAPSWQSSISSGFCTSSAKALPDVSLNGDWANSPQSVYFNGSFSGNGGTSISAPMMGGFYAQQNSYGIELGSICGGGSSACAPIGQGGQQLYLAAASGAQGKKSLYDITSGCTTNEVGPGFCAITGYDRATGWGTPNMLQFAWANNYWNMPEASPPAISMSGPSTSGWVNSGSISWSIVDQGSPASGVAGYTAQWDSDPGDPVSGTPGTGNSFYSGPASAHGATSGSAGLLVGCHTLYVRAWDNIAESAVNHYGPVCYDNTAPTLTVPTMSFVSGQTVDPSGSASVNVKWTGSDDLSGISSFLLWQSTDGGAFVHLTPDDAVNHRTVSLAPGHTYQFAIGAFDNAGNFGGYLFSKTINLTEYQEGVRSIVYSSGWQRVADATALGGHLEFATQSGNTATFTFKGNKVMWVAPKDTNRGSSSATLDAGTPKTVNLNANSAQPRLGVYVASAANRTHTLVVTCSGTAGHPRIDVDAFYVINYVK